MTVKDKIYGEVKIDEKILLDLINSQAIQRLKAIEQLGLPQEYISIKGFSRYDHSIGVMLLLRTLGASLEEQIAGLLHDASHTAFSHVADYLFGSTKHENFQDSVLENYLSKSDVPLILKKHGFHLEKFTDHRRFGLLERHSPNLCADRVDYALREFNAWLDPKSMPELIKSLTVYENKIVFQDVNLATKFSEGFLKLQRSNWGSPKTTFAFYALSEILRYALKKRIILTSDIFSTDEEVMNKLKDSQNRKIMSVLGQIKSYNPDTHRSGEKKQITKKFRYVDPEILINGRIKRLSKISDTFKKNLEQEKAHNQKGVTIYIHPIT